MSLRTAATVLSNFAPSGSPSFANATGLVGLALPANPKRITMFVQNIHTGLPLYVTLGTGTASASFFSLILNPATSPGFGGERFTNDFYKGSVICSGGGWQAWDM